MALRKGFALALLTPAGLLMFGSVGPATSGVAKRATIAFASHRGVGGIQYIRLVGSDGSGDRQLTRAGNNTAPAWSPKTHEIFFEGNAPGSFIERIWAIRSDGTAKRRLPMPPNVGSPALSHDGHMIAFVDVNDQIEVANVDGTRVRVLTRKGLNYEPAWSPDGKHIAFESDRGTSGRERIYVMNADGTDQRRLVGQGTGEFDNDDPAWSPDGRKLAFSSDRTNDRQIFVMNSVGGGLHRLTHDRGENDSKPSWSPDGRTIAYGSTAGGYQIWTVNSDGTNQRRLTRGPGDFDPAWSPY